MQKYNLVNFADLWSRNIFEVLFVIPEIYVCNLAEARDQTYFGQNWKDLHLSACNGGKGNQFISKRGCVVRIVVDSILPHAECGPNDRRKGASRL